MMELARQIASSGHKCIISQLELREEQVGERELTALAGYGVRDLTQSAAKTLRENLDLETLRNLYITFIGNTVESHKAILWPILASHPEIKFWLMDYNERLYTYGGRIDRNMQAEEVAKFSKDTATMFNVCCIPLLQTNDRYYKDGANGPHIDHIDYGKKWRKDAQWLGFVHHPHQFDTETPRNYVELRTLLTRDTAPQMMKLNWTPSRYRYEQWTSDSPSQPDIHVQNFKKNAPEMEELNEVHDSIPW